jgi:coenzyme F420-0:L-glutamate ligase / coenzyme F420-1:gamma-L-glutamate ligase
MITAVALPGIPEVAPGDDLGAMLADAAPENLGDGDVLVVAQKVVSKAEGRVVRLRDVEPSPRAVELAATLGKDARAVEVVLGEADTVVRAARGVLIVRTHHGFVCANAGVDASNAPGSDALVLLPVDPDASARALRARVAALRGVRPAVVIADSFGRAWRRGQSDVAIGCAGLLPLDDWTGRVDNEGRELRATQIAVADQAAAAADLARTKDSGEPAVLVRGLDRYVSADDGPGAVAGLVRDPAEDLFL